MCNLAIKEAEILFCIPSMVSWQKKNKIATLKILKIVAA